MKCYECAICLSINHSSKHACSICGTIPAKYSLMNRETKPLQKVVLNSGDINDSMIETVVAWGVQRLTSHHASRVSGFRTVTATYYAESEV